MGLMVIDSGFWTTAQDAGRPGFREYGVPAGGPFDRGSADLANALVGNGPDCAVLELTLRGGVFEALGSMGIALAGAPIEASIVGTDGNPRRFRVPSSGSLHAGERLVLGRTLEGARALSVGPGRISDARADGKPIVRAAPAPRRFLECAGEDSPHAVCRRAALEQPSGGALPDHRRTGSRLHDRPRVLEAQPFSRGLAQQSHGLALEGPPLELTAQPDRLSAPVAPGAIQVAGGQLILLGVACGTMGGYPHVAHVISADLDRAGQLSPGDSISFFPVDLETARNLDRAARQAHRASLIRVASLARDA